MDRLIEKEAIAGQIMPHTAAFTIAHNTSDLREFGRIAGEPDYIGRQGIEFYPQELLLLRIAKNPPTTPKEECVYATNVQYQKSKYKIPEDTIELETKYLFALTKGTEIRKFQNNYSGIVVLFPYEKSDPRKPLGRRKLSEYSPKLLEYYLTYKDVIEQETEYSDKIRGPESGEFYGLARVGSYSFAKHYVAFRDNTKWCAVVLSPIRTSWGEQKRFVFQNHAVAICEDKDNRFITEDEAHYVCAILNAPTVERYVLQSSDSRFFKIRPPVRIPKYDENNVMHKELSSLSKRAHSNPEAVDRLLKEIDCLYMRMLK